MNQNVWMFLACFVIPTVNAQAQPQVTPGSVAFTLDWTRIDPVTGAVLGQGLGPYLHPGEALRVQIRMNYAPAYGGAVTYPPSLGGSGTGTIEGFGAGAMNLVINNGSATGAGTWLGTGTSVPLPLRRMCLTPFAVLGVSGAGTVAASGAILENIQPGQFQSSVSQIAPVNNVLVWQGTWVPSSFAPNTITVELLPNSAGIWPAHLVVRDSNPANTFPIFARAEYTFGQFTVPAPGSAASLLGVLALVGQRRRRRTIRGGGPCA